nr:Dam family site-specific DNA-(adenine-N6)-methyltransferase [Brucella intermedia]
MWPIQSRHVESKIVVRFIGNKELIVPEILVLLDKQGLLGKQLTFLDAFCGTGAVSDAVKDYFKVIANDLLEWCGVYTHGRLVGSKCTFSKLGFNPFIYFKQNQQTIDGFFTKTYSPSGSTRMYFTARNAGRIDFIRQTIETWRTDRLITKDEYAFLLASLLQSLSSIANTAGVYGAFLKKWDPRALKELDFAPIEFNNTANQGFEIKNRRIEEIIAETDCDILYLDPPYTQNQYGTQYHILETLVKNDEPAVSAITGSRPTRPMRSDWSRDMKTHILLDRVIASTKAKYILVSYSADGFMSKSFIETVLKRYGKNETFICQTLPYRKYTNTKSRENGKHEEYLFFIQKKEKSLVTYTSPLNYIGSKTNMLPFIKKYIPTNIQTFIDAFGGAFNVGINSSAKKIIYNDYNHLVADLIESFNHFDTYDYIKFVKKQIKRFGLEKENSKSYEVARAYYNSLPEQKRDPRLLYTIILYGFNQQIRFNSDMDFNNPVGQRWFNEKILEKLISYSRFLKENDVTFRSLDFEQICQEADTDSFVYLDPPYRLTTGAYNDGKRGFKGWDLESEQRLMRVLNELDTRSIKFMLSYVLEHRGKYNIEMKKWISTNHFRVVECAQIQGIGRKEVVIFNYDPSN